MISEFICLEHGLCSSSCSCGQLWVCPCVHLSKLQPTTNWETCSQTIDTSKRIINFREQFSAIYCFPDGYFDVRDKNNILSLTGTGPISTHSPTPSGVSYL